MKNHSLKTMKTWIMAVRPKTLGAAIAPVLIGTAMAFDNANMHWKAALAALIGAILIQIGTNFANDYYDFVNGADTEKRLGPVRVTQAGLVQAGTMRLAFIGIFALAFVVGLYLVARGGWPILLVGVLSIIFGILYTGGPYPLGYNGLGDAFVLIFFGPIAVGGTYYVQTLEINSVVLLAGFAPGLLSTALLAVNNLRDINTDREANKRTLPVRYGAAFARMEYLLTISGACLLPVLLAWLTGKHYFSMLAVGVLLLALPAIKTVFKEQGTPVLNIVLGNTGKLLLIYSLIFSIGWIL